jgi:hypothetical protein
MLNDKPLSVLPVASQELLGDVFSKTIVSVLPETEKLTDAETFLVATMLLVGVTYITVA